MNTDERAEKILRKLINGKRCTSADGRLLAKAIENLYQHLMLLRAAITHFGEATGHPIEPDHLVERYVQWLELSGKMGEAKP